MMGSIPGEALNPATLGANEELYQCEQCGSHRTMRRLCGRQLLRIRTLASIRVMNTGTVGMIFSAIPFTTSGVPPSALAATLFRTTRISCTDSAVFTIFPTGAHDSHAFFVASLPPTRGGKRIPRAISCTLARMGPRESLLRRLATYDHTVHAT